MRIIRIAVVLRLAFLILLPQLALAAEASENSNETNTNFEIKENIIIDQGVAKDKNDLLLANAPYKYEGYEPVKTKRDIQVEKVLEKYKAKREKADLPEGKFVINASAYTAAADECGKSDGITASGLLVKERETIACPPSFPLGTKLHIEGMGVYMCQDRGGAIKGNHIDIYMETKAQAFKFGRRNLLAEVVK